MLRSVLQWTDHIVGHSSRREVTMTAFSFIFSTNSEGCQGLRRWEESAALCGDSPWVGTVCPSDCQSLGLISSSGKGPGQSPPGYSIIPSHGQSALKSGGALCGGGSWWWRGVGFPAKAEWTVGTHCAESSWTSCCREGDGLSFLFSELC